MKYLKYLLFIILAVAVVAAIALTANQTQTQESARITVATTIFPLTDMAEQLVGEDVHVVSLLPAGASPHTFEPKPSDIRKLQSAEVLFVVGHGLDDWAAELAESVDVEIVVVDDGATLREFEDVHAHADEHDSDEHDDDSGSEETQPDPATEITAGHDHDEEHHDHDAHDDHDHDAHDDHEEEGDHHGHDHEGTDPHYWLSVQNAKAIVDVMTETLQSIDPEFADQYAQNAATYKTTLEGLEEELAETLAPIADAALIVFHDSWSYFAAEYDLNIVGVFEPSPGKAPSPQDLQALNELVTEYSIPAVFSEPQLSESTILPFVQDLDLSLFTLDPIGGGEGRTSYVELMRYNAGVLVEALNR